MCVCVGVHRCGARVPKLSRRAAGSQDEDEAAASGVLSQNSVRTSPSVKQWHAARSTVYTYSVLDGRAACGWTGFARARCSLREEGGEGAFTKKE